MADWCALPEGVVASIARCFQLIEDFMAFRATCTSWREGTSLKDFYTSPSCPKLPLLMLYKREVFDFDEYKISLKCYEGNQRKDPEEECKELIASIASSRKHRNDFLRNHPADEREFSSLSKGKTCKFSFPEAVGMECRGSKGWFTLAERRTGKMCLLHPITRAQILLPQIPLPKALPEVGLPINPRSAVLSASPSETSDYVVMVAYVERGYISGSYIVFWKPGNERWTRVEIPDCVDDLNYYKGKFYALTYKAQVWMCDVTGPNPNNKATIITELPWEDGSRPKAQLVECEGRLLVIAPFIYRVKYKPYEHDLEMVELDVAKGSYSIRTSLGSSAVFLGRNQGFSIDANKFGGIIQPNLIYFSDGINKIAARGPDHISRPCACSGVWISF